MVTITTVAGVPTYGTDKPPIRPVEAVSFEWDAAAGTPGSGVELVRIPPGVKVGGTTDVAGRLRLLASPSQAVPVPARALKPIGPIVLDVAADLEPVTPPAADPVDESVYRHGAAYDEQATSDESVPDDDGEAVADEHPSDEEAAADEEADVLPPIEDVGPPDGTGPTADQNKIESRRSESDRVEHRRAERERADRERLERERDSAEALRRRADRDDRLRRMAEPDHRHWPQFGGVASATIDDVRPPEPVDHERLRGNPPPPAASVGGTPPHSTVPPHATSGGSASADGSRVMPGRAALPAMPGAETPATPSAAGFVSPFRGVTFDVGAIRAMTHAHPADAVHATAGSAPLDVFTLIRPA